MSEMTLVGTWQHHWFSRTYSLNKYYVFHTYPEVCFLLINVLFHQFDHSVSQKYNHDQS